MDVPQPRLDSVKELEMGSEASAQDILINPNSDCFDKTLVDNVLHPKKGGDSDNGVTHKDPVETTNYLT